MPDLEQRIRDALDRLGQRPDPARVLGQVGRRKRHLRLMHRIQTVALVVAVLAGVGGGMYALTRAFGVGASRPVPGSTSVRPSASSAPSVTELPSPSPAATPPPPSASATPAIARCSDQNTQITVASQQGAAGTISTVWQAKNTAATPCRSFAYPGMDFHTASGWLNVQVHRGGFASINQPPRTVVVPPGQSLYFGSYWNDVPTNGGPCQQFDRVKVTLPDNFVSAEVASSGCLDPLSVDVGPVTSTPAS
jgi:hypothetical protein